MRPGRRTGRRKVILNDPRLSVRVLSNHRRPMRMTTRWRLPKSRPSSDVCAPADPDAGINMTLLSASADRGSQAAREARAKSGMKILQIRFAASSMTSKPYCQKSHRKRWFHPFERSEHRQEEPALFYISYAFAELRRRKGRTLFTALGLAVGVGLVVTVSALSTGLDDAQDEVLKPLTGVGTDMSVTRPLKVSGNGTDANFRVAPGTPPGPGAGGPVGPPGLSQEEQKKLRKENGGGGLVLPNIVRA